MALARVMDGLVAVADFAAVHRLEPGHQREQRRLAGAVRADDADQVAGRHGEADVIGDA